MPIDEGFLKELLSKKKEKTYQKYEAAKLDLEEIRKSEEDIRSRQATASGDDKGRLDREWEKLEARRKTIEEQVHKLDDLIQRVKSMHLEQSLLRKLEVIGLLFDLPKPLIYGLIPLAFIFGVVLTTVILIAIFSMLSNPIPAVSVTTITTLSTTTTTSTIIDPVVCNPPYIRYGKDCCLDANSNHICDKDEPTTTDTTNTMTVQSNTPKDKLETTSSSSSTTTTLEDKKSCGSDSDCPPKSYKLCSNETSCS